MPTVQFQNNLIIKMCSESGKSMKPSKLKVNVLIILLFAVVAVVVLVLFEYRQITTDSRQQILISPVEQMRLKMRQESEPIAKLDPAAQLGILKMVEIWVSIIPIVSTQVLLPLSPMR